MIKVLISTDIIAATGLGSVSATDEAVKKYDLGRGKCGK